MICPKCSSKLKIIDVEIAGAKSKVKSFQCTKCNYFSFEENSSKKALSELNESPLKIRQKIVMLSQDRLGIYFNSNVIRSLNIKRGDEIYVSVPDKNKILIEL